MSTVEEGLKMRVIIGLDSCLRMGTGLAKLLMID